MKYGIIYYRQHSNKADCIQRVYNLLSLNLPGEGIKTITLDSPETQQQCGLDLQTVQVWPSASRYSSGCHDAEYDEEHTCTGREGDWKDKLCIIYHNCMDKQLSGFQFTNFLSKVGQIS